MLIQNALTVKSVAGTGHVIIYYIHYKLFSTALGNTQDSLEK